MKRKLLLFLVIIGVSMLTLPFTNLLFSSHLDRRSLTQSFLFNGDGVASLFARMTYPLGISKDSRVLIGRNNWLYLDSEYQEKPTEPNERKGEQNLGLRIGAALERWNTFFAANKVRVFRYLLLLIKSVSSLNFYLPGQSLKNRFSSKASFQNQLVACISIPVNSFYAKSQNTQVPFTIKLIPIGMPWVRDWPFRHLQARWVSARLKFVGLILRYLTY